MALPIRVLMIDDDKDDFFIVQDLLAEVRGQAYAPDLAATYEDGLRIALETRHDVLLVDYRLGQRTGLELVGELVAADCETPVIVLTGQEDPDIDRAATKAGAYDYLIKGRFDSTLLERTIRYTLERSRTQRELAYARARETEIGGRIQSTLLLHRPPLEIRGASIAAVSRPSQRVDGDFWDFVQYDRNRFDVLVGDVMGKGVPAALIAAASKGHFQRAIRRLMLELRDYGRIPEPEEVVAAVHHAVTRELADLDSFVTLCYARFDMRNRQIVFVDGGHVRTIHYERETERVRFLDGSNVPLGVNETEMYAQSTTCFSCGDSFVFYSDGVTEARSPSGEYYGAEKLAELVLRGQALGAQGLADLVCASALEFAGQPKLDDDLTCVVVKIHDDPVDAPIAHAAMEVHSNPSELDAMRRFVEWFCVESASPPLSKDDANSLMLAVTEAATNVLEHAYWGARDRRLQVIAEAYPGSVSIELYDWGQPFDPSGVAAPKFDSTADGGFGVYIIEHCVDECRYYRDDIGRNCLRLVRRHRPA